MTTPQPLDDRLAKAEAALAELTRELSAIRAELGGAPRAAEPAVPARPGGVPPRKPVRPPRPARSFDFERLLGRYGMLGIAVLAAVAAVGTFLSWAISQGYLTLGPTARVLLGLAFAGTIGAWGFRLRRREKSFGSSLVGLALVIVLVCAYAAGPGFHLVPTSVAFVGSSAIAWALAIFARREDDEPLWCVAFGGAAIAPFATSSGDGNLYGLLAYALVLLLAACFGISHRAWPVAWRVFYLASLLFVGSAAWLAGGRGATGAAATFALPLVVGAAGIMPFAPDSRKRAALRWLAILALLATAAFSVVVTGTSLLVGEILLAVALWLLIVDRLRGVEQSSLLQSNAPPGRAPMLHWIDGAAIPLFFAIRAAALVAPELTPLIYGTTAVMCFAMAWRHPVGSSRDASAFACMLAALAAFVRLSPDLLLVRVAGFLALALGALLMHKLRPSLSWVATGVAVLASAATLSVQSLTDRPSYVYAPFATTPSLTAFLVTATLTIIARFWPWLLDATRGAMGRRARRTYAGGLRALLDATVAAPWIWAFVWVMIELSMAHSASISTLLLVTYFAATAVASVAAGRLRRSARLRQVGLALALAAAATSVYGASTYFDIGIRIVAYLVTSAFLLGIAYWYRRPGTATANA